MNWNKFSSLLVGLTILATTTPASAQLTREDVNLIGIGAGILNGIINPPHREAEIKAEAEIKKAKIEAQMELEKEKMRLQANADKVTPILNRWGVQRVICAPGVVFINGIDGMTNAVCAQPSEAFTPGYYTYDSAKGQLLRTRDASVQQIQVNTKTTVTSNATSQGF
jgi:hypothetical protein